MFNMHVWLYILQESFAISKFLLFWVKTHLQHCYKIVMAVSADQLDTPR